MEVFLINFCYAYVTSQDNEIYASIRSIYKYCKDPFTVTIFGDEVPYLNSQIKQIIVDRISPKPADIANKIFMMADTYEDFVFMSDDQYFLKPFVLSDIKPTALYDLETVKKWRKGYYYNMLRNTMHRCLELGLQAYNYDTHTPRYFESEKLKNLKGFNFSGKRHLIISAYFNSYFSNPEIETNRLSFWDSDDPFLLNDKLFLTHGTNQRGLTLDLKWLVADYFSGIYPHEEKDLSMISAPKISALMVTKNGRDLVEKAIDSFISQTYFNKELVIVCDKNKPVIDEILSDKDTPNIKVVHINEKLPLAALRNISLHAATGDYMMQWDDDDYYANDRMMFQMKQLKETKSEAVLLKNIEVVFREKNCRCSWPHGFLGSILFKRDIYFYSNTEKKAEDVTFTRKWRKGPYKITALDNPPGMYFYVFHGNNTWNEVHFQRIKNKRSV